LFGVLFDEFCSLSSEKPFFTVLISGTFPVVKSLTQLGTVSSFCMF